MSVTDYEATAINSFNCQAHLYLNIIHTDVEERLVIVVRSWIGRILMWFGWSNSSMEKIIKYVDKRFDQLIAHQGILPERKALLFGKIQKYCRKHPKKGVKYQETLAKIDRYSLLEQPQNQQLDIIQNQINGFLDQNKCDDVFSLLAQLSNPVKDTLYIKFTEALIGKQKCKTALRALALISDTEIDKKNALRGQIRIVLEEQCSNRSEE